MRAMKIATSRGLRFMLIAIAFLLFCLLIRQFFSIKTELDNFTRHGLSSYILAYAICVLPLLLFARWIIIKDTFSGLGFGRPLLPAFLAALLFATPMLAGGLLLFPWADDLQWERIAAGSMVTGFMEELVYRAFLFGLLFYAVRLGFVLSVVSSALLFATAHLGQGQSQNLMVFLVTLMAGGYFAWLYAEWDRNLWMPVFMHAFMNLAWMLFDMDQTAAGGWKANMLRALSIALSVFLTLRWRRKRHTVLAVNKGNLWIEPWLTSENSRRE